MPEYGNVEEEGCAFDEECERSWRAYLKDFKDSVFPVFQEHGFTLSEAFIAWQMNRTHNAMNAVRDIIEDNKGL